MGIFKDNSPSGRNAFRGINKRAILLKLILLSLFFNTAHATTATLLGCLMDFLTPKVDSPRFLDPPPPKLEHPQLSEGFAKEISMEFPLTSLSNPAQNADHVLFLASGRRVFLDTANYAILAKTPAEGLRGVQLPGVGPDDLVAVKISKVTKADELKMQEEADLADWAQKMSRKIEHTSKHPELFVPVRRLPETNHLISPYDPNLIPLDIWVQRVKAFYPEGIDVSIINRIEDNLDLIIDELRRMHLVHGDIKPDNLLINPNTYDLKILDFEGMAELGGYPPKKPFKGQRRIMSAKYGSRNARKGRPAAYEDDSEAALAIYAHDLEDLIKK